MLRYSYLHSCYHQSFFTHTCAAITHSSLILIFMLSSLTDFMLTLLHPYQLLMLTILHAYHQDPSYFILSIKILHTTCLPYSILTMLHARHIHAATMLSESHLYSCCLYTHDYIIPILAPTLLCHSRLLLCPYYLTHACYYLTHAY